MTDRTIADRLRAIPVVLVLGVAVALGAPAVAAQAVAADPADLQKSIARGGRLYDNWYREIGEPAPEKSHPAYPRAGRFEARPRMNWRCSECHGWDYLGRDGAYAAGEHFTGIEGIQRLAGAHPVEIVSILKDDTHALTGRLNDGDFRDLANFVSKGQVDTDAFIDRGTRRAKGDARKYSAHFQTICVNCHGRDGRELKAVPALGEAARNHPWNALHKILNGHPAEDMPALRVLEPDVVRGILAYIQTLPAMDMQASISRGGRLYDNWALEIGAPLPIRSRAPYPPGKNYAEGVEDRWRCAECHGWDYRGSAGALSSGASYTGIRGISRMAGAAPQRIIAILKDERHEYGPLLEEHDFVDLANFVAKGQVDMDAYIDRTTRKAKGDPARHAPYFGTVCAGCHGQDGLTIRTMSALGAIANDNPWETLHKMLNGHPAEDMPALRTLDRPVAAGILAYIQTLSTGDLAASIARGGRLYDNWHKETKVTPPARPHPSYPKGGKYADKPATTWRCKECHGWDYRGDDGDYAEGRHYTGIKGIRGMAGADPARLVAVLKDGAHAYEGLLDESDLQDLANFVSKGQVDMDMYIDRATGKTNADSTKHKGYYTTICVSCHGEDGARNLTMPPLGKTGKSNPWEVLHKILNGPPGDSHFHSYNLDEKMPELRVLDMEIIVGILAYIQTLPADVMVHSY